MPRSRKRSRSESKSAPARASKRQRFAFKSAARNSTRSKLSALTGPLGHKVRTKLRYVETVTSATTAGTSTRYLLNTNSCNDPNAGIGGHQPMGYDQYSPLYQHYTVLSADVKVTFVPHNTNNGDGTTWICADLVPNSGSNKASFSALMEPNSSNGVPVGAFNTKSQVSFRRYIDNAKFLGMTRSQYIAADENRALTASNPVEDIILMIYMSASDDTSATQGGEIIIEVMYDVIFSEPQPIGQS